MTPDQEKEPMLRIGEAEKLTGLTARQIRYYESNGLIAATRTAGNQRLYPHSVIDRLKRIKGLIEAGHSLASIKNLLDKTPAPQPAKPARLEPNLPQAKGLSSLYPVRNQGKLFELLWRRERE